MKRRSAFLGILVVFAALLPALIATAAIPGPVAAWGFDESGGTTTADATGGALIGVVNGPTRNARGIFGGVLSFDDVDDWLTLVDEDIYNSPPPPPPADTTAPTVAVTAPAQGATVGGSSVVVSATASDDVGVSGVQFLLDGAPLGPEDTTAPYTTTWDTTTTTNASHTLTAVARDAAANTTTSSAITVTVDTGAPPPPPARDPAQVGQWSAVVDFPIVPVHMTPMADGTVVMWDAYDPSSERLFDPQTLSFTTIPNGGRDLFCSVNVKLPDGRLMVAGGHSSTALGTTELNIYDPSTRQWTSGAPMARARWYPSSTQLADGRQFVISGDDYDYQVGQPVPLRFASNTVPEIYDPAANSWSTMPSAARRIPWYPFMFLLPDGRLFDAGPDQITRTLDLSTGTWTTVGTSQVEGHSAVMYRPGKIMKSGNFGNSGTLGRVATGRAAAIDMNEPSPAWREVSPMSRARTYHTLTALPDGTVLSSGGSAESSGQDPAHAVREPEIWDPVTDTWKVVASSQRPRLYHSSATLLQDGRVLLAGGGRHGSGPNELNGEIYSPPYLFKGPRPTITSAPTAVPLGASFAIDTPDGTSITSASLVRMSSITHNVDQDQRFQFLGFRQRSGGLEIDLPSNGNVVPPGVYQLFILSDKGVPSVAKIVTIPVGGRDVTPPSAPSDLRAEALLGRAQLSWTAATDNVAVVQYRVHRSTTSGFAPSDANRIATLGAATSYTDETVANGTSYQYRVVAADAEGNGSAASGQATAVIPADTTAPAVAVTAPARAHAPGRRMGRSRMRRELRRTGRRAGARAHGRARADRRPLITAPAQGATVGGCRSSSARPRATTSASAACSFSSTARHSAPRTQQRPTRQPGTRRQRPTPATR